MFDVLLIRPGSTTFDEEGRMKGALDIPLTPDGTRQVELAAEQLAKYDLDCLYVAPCESAQQTGLLFSKRCGWKRRTVECFRNVDHGLWQGKLVEEVRRHQPRVYKQFQESPVNICPPGGESLADARQRIDATVRKLGRRHRGGLIGLVVPEPMASLVRCALLGCSFGDVWKSELDAGNWELIRVEAPCPVLA